jgi:hypothetical protein
MNLSFMDFLFYVPFFCTAAGEVAEMYTVCLVNIYRQGLIAFPEPFLKIRCFGSITFSGCSEKSFFALSEKSVSEREARTHNVWYQL